MNEVWDVDRMIAPDLVEMGQSGPRIVAGHRRADRKITFPLPLPSSGESQYERVLLSQCGTLWSWTVQRFRPKSPPFLGADGDEFSPFYVGYVEFPEGVIVEGHIDAVVDVDDLYIGMPMETTLLPFVSNAEGNMIIIHAFKPVIEDVKLKGDGE